MTECRQLILVHAECEACHKEWSRGVFRNPDGTRFTVPLPISMCSHQAERVGLFSEKECDACGGRVRSSRLELLMGAEVA